MKFLEPCQEENEDIKSFIGDFTKNPIVAKIKIGTEHPGDYQENEWCFLAIKFTSDASHLDILKFIVKASPDDFYGIEKDYYILWFD